jgi:hypothetical protein
VSDNRYIAGRQKDTPVAREVKYYIVIQKLNGVIILTKGQHGRQVGGDYPKKTFLGARQKTGAGKLCGVKRTVT